MQIVKSEHGGTSALAAAGDGRTPGEGEARTLIGLYDAAQNGMRKVIALGLFAHEVKSRLKHGQFGHWLAEHAPKLSRQIDGRPLPSKTLSSYMQLTSGVLESAGFKLGAFLEMSKITQGDLSHGGEILLLDEGQVPESCRAFREKICSVVDGKTQRQLFLEFKTTDDDGEDVKVKRAGGVHHPIKQTPEEKLEAEKLAAVAFGQQLATDTREALDQWKDYQEDGKLRLPAVLHWPAKLRQEIRGLQIELGKVLDGIGRGKKGHDAETRRHGEGKKGGLKK